MLRISRTELDGIVTLQLEGKLLAPWVNEVEAMVVVGGNRLRLDLAHVTFVDRAGAQLLRNLQGQGVDVTDCSQFVLEVLRAETGHSGDRRV